MMLLANSSELAQQLSARLGQLNELLFAGLGAPAKTLTLKSGEALSGQLPASHWAIVESGCVCAQRSGANVVKYEATDLLGMSQGYGLPDLDYCAQTPTTLAVYPVGDVLRYLHADKKRAAQWTAFLLTQLSVYQQSLVLETGDTVATSAGFLQFSAGETIITEGDPAGEVYHVVQGHADVYRAGVVVGEILPGELFGAMAMLCGSARTATVVARDDVLVAAVPQEDFQSLIQQHPETAVTLMTNMARAINDLNDRLQTQEARDSQV